MSSSIIGSEKFTKEETAFRDGSGYRRGKAFLWGAYDRDGTMDGASCLKSWRQLQRFGGSSGFQPSLTAECPLLPQKGELAFWSGEKDFPKMTWCHLNPLNNLGLQSKWNKWTLSASMITDVVASAQQLFNPCLKHWPDSNPASRPDRKWTGNTGDEGIN